MTLVKVFYWFSVAVLAACAIVFFMNSWLFMGIICSIVVLGSTVNYFDIIILNKEDEDKPPISRRTKYFQSMNDSEREEYIRMLNEEIEEIESIKK